MTLYALFILFGYAFFNPVKCESIQLEEKNIGSVLADHELVFINFYVSWCRYSNLMAPIFEEASVLVQKEFGQNSDRVAMGKVDCDAESAIAKRFAISKYPTLKISLNGDVMKKEYRGQRSAEALLEYIREQLTDPIQEIKTVEEMNAINATKRTIIAYFDRLSITSPEYNIYRKVAASLKDDCNFYAAFDESVSTVKKGDPPTIVFRPDADSHEAEEVYEGKIHADELKIWAQDNCIPLVREITFENAEELTEEGMPFMILFYDPNNTQPIREYKARVEEELISEKQNVNFLTASGKTFAHPLQHLNKELTDLPVIAIDSFRHMYLFPDFQDIYKPGKLKKFIADLHSGKLHREFHYGPEDSKEEEEKAKEVEAKVEETGEEKDKSKPEEKTGTESTSEQKDEQPTEEPPKAKAPEEEIDDPTEEGPPDSTFVKLAPSEKRYTLLRNEL